MRFLRWSGLGALVGLLTLAAPTVGSGQGLTTGAVGGIVTDSTGRPLEGAQIQIRNEASGYRVNVTTRSTGRFFVPGLVVGGPYTVSIRMLGYAPYTKSEVQVLIGQTALVEARMGTTATQLQALNITANADESDFAPTRQGIATIVGDTLLRRLPLLH